MRDVSELAGLPVQSLNVAPLVHLVPAGRFKFDLLKDDVSAAALH